MIRNILLLGALCLLPVPALASEADFEKSMARGVSVLDAGHALQAREEFRAALKDHPDDREAGLYLAIALNRGGDQEAESALKEALRRDPGNARINFELGTLYYGRKLYQEAAEYFENLLALQPDPEMRRGAQAYLAAIRPADGGKRWGATLMGGMQYDSNVQLVGDGVQLPAGSNSRKGDLRGVLNLGLNGTGILDSQQVLTGRYALYQTLHLHLSDFNLTQNLLEVSYQRKITPIFSGTLVAGFESFLLGGNPFVLDYTIAPGLQASFREGMTTGLEYRFRDSYFRNSALFPDNRDRSGVTHSLLLSHRQRVAQTLTLRAEYAFERDLADVRAWSSRTHRGVAGLAVTPRRELLLELSVEASTSSYDEVLAGAQRVRSDTAVSGTAALTWQAFAHAGVALGYYQAKNFSNIPDYEYVRGITSLMFQGRY